MLAHRNGEYCLCSRGPEEIKKQTLVESLAWSKKDASSSSEAWRGGSGGHHGPLNTHAFLNAFCPCFPSCSDALNIGMFPSGF